MTATTTTRSTDAVPSHALRRGTRGFAAVVLGLAAMIVLAVSIFVLPASAIDAGLLVLLVPLGIAFGIAHLVAIWGTLRRRRWAVRLTLYLMAAGLGTAAFVLLLVATGVDPFLPAGADPTLQGRIDTVGLVVWLVGSWIVGPRFVVRGLAPAELDAPDPAVDGERVMATHPLIVAVDATRTRTGLRPRSA